MVTTNFFFFVYLYGRTINSGIILKKSSGVTVMDAAWLDCWRSLASEADGRRTPQQPQDCDDQWLLLRKELG